MSSGIPPDSKTGLSSSGIGEAIRPFRMNSTTRPSQFTRREFLVTTALASIAPLGVSADPASQEKPAGTAAAVDTHVHCFAGKEDPRFPYHDRAPYRPDAPATPRHLLKCMDELGIAHAIIVHPEPYQDDHRYLEYCLEVGRKRFKGTCLFFADRPGSLAKLPDLVKRFPIVAVRVHAYAPDRLPPFGKPELRDLWRLAAENGLAVQIHMEPRYAPGFEPLIKEFAETPVIIDHLGRPVQGTPEEHERVVRWSDLKNTVLKLSAIPATASYPHRNPTQVIRRLIESFGPGRIISGGGFSTGATTASYRAALDELRKSVGHLQVRDQEKILGGNAVKLFHL